MATSAQQPLVVISGAQADRLMGQIRSGRGTQTLRSWGWLLDRSGYRRLRHSGRDALASSREYGRNGRRGESPPCGRRSAGLSTSPSSARPSRPWRWTQLRARAGFARLDADGGRSGRQGEEAQAVSTASALGLAAWCTACRRAARHGAWRMFCGLGAPLTAPARFAALHRALAMSCRRCSSVDCPVMACQGALWWPRQPCVKAADSPEVESAGQGPQMRTTSDHLVSARRLDHHTQGGSCALGRQHQRSRPSGFAASCPGKWLTLLASVAASRAGT